MNSSPEINELATALAKAQAMMTGALKDSANPFFKSKYADLESVWQACRKALTDNGMAVVQYGAVIDQDGGAAQVLVTRLLHSSGQWLEGCFPIRAKDESPQAMGSAITYARRYGLAAMVGVYQTDDDAEAAQGRPMQHSPHPDTSAIPKGQAQTYADAFIDRLRANDPVGVLNCHSDLQAEGKEAYSAAWQLLSAPDRAEIKRMIEKSKAAAF
jgi:hypothetical protein